MPGPWITTDAVKQLIADALTKDVSSLPVKWTNIAARANTAAANDIQSRLLAKLFTAAQIDAWDERVTFNQDIAMCYALIYGASLSQYDLSAVNDTLKRRLDELEKTPSLMINGSLQAPGTTLDDAGIGMGGGVIDDTNYRVNMDTKF